MTALRWTSSDARGFDRATDAGRAVKAAVAPALVGEGLTWFVAHAAVAGRPLTVADVVGYSAERPHVLGEDGRWRPASEAEAAAMLAAAARAVVGFSEDDRRRFVRREEALR